MITTQPLRYENGIITNETVVLISDKRMDRKRRRSKKKRRKKRYIQHKPVCVNVRSTNSKMPTTELHDDVKIQTKR